MDNQHTLIKGYRNLSQEEIDMMNAIKQAGYDIGALIKAMNERLTVEMVACMQQESAPGFARLAEAEKWLEEGRASIQKGIMFLVRSVARPDDGI